MNGGVNEDLFVERRLSQEKFFLLEILTTSCHDNDNNNHCTLVHFALSLENDLILHDGNNEEVLSLGLRRSTNCLSRPNSFT